MKEEGSRVQGPGFRVQKSPEGANHSIAQGETLGKRIINNSNEAREAGDRMEED